MKIHIRLVFLTTVVAVLMSGNSFVFARTSALEGDTVQTKAYILHQCLVSQKQTKKDANLIGSIAAIVLPKLIEKAIGGIGALLQRAGEKEDLKSVATAPSYLYAIDETEKPRKLLVNSDLDGGCLLVVRGTFSKPDDRDDAGKLQPAENLNTTDIVGNLDQHEERLVRLRENGIHVSRIDLLYEAQVITSSDATAIRYESRFLEITNFLGKRDQKKPRGIVISLGLAKPGTSEAAPVSSLAALNMGELTKTDAEPIVLNQAAIEGFRSSWLSGLALSSDEAKALQTANMGANLKMYAVPVNFIVTITETEDGNKALKFIGDLLADVKKDVGQTISDSVLRDRKAEALVEAGKDESAIADEEKTYSDYQGALIAYVRVKAATDRVINDTNASESDKEIARREEIIEKVKVEKGKRQWCLKRDAMLTRGIVPPPRAESCP